MVRIHGDSSRGGEREELTNVVCCNFEDVDVGDAAATLPPIEVNVQVGQRRHASQWRKATLPRPIYSISFHKWSQVDQHVDTGRRNVATSAFNLIGRCQLGDLNASTCAILSAKQRNMKCDKNGVE